MVKIGKSITDFRLPALLNGEIKDISLSEYKGKWLILIFYPADFTFVCPTELKMAAERYQDFQKLGAEILSVSTDDVKIHKDWYNRSDDIRSIKYPMLSDIEKVMCKEFGTLIEEKGISLRATFIIDPDQKLLSIEVNENSVGRNMDETMRKLQAYIFVRDNKGQVLCPAGWIPGMEGIRPPGTDKTETDKNSSN
jgi:peroxiredoxin (alkyl hydroperoxide reductase subunit C)